MARRRVAVASRVWVEGCVVVTTFVMCKTLDTVSVQSELSRVPCVGVHWLSVFVCIAIAIVSLARRVWAVSCESR